MQGTTTSTSKLLTMLVNKHNKLSYGSYGGQQQPKYQPYSRDNASEVQLDSRVSVNAAG